MRANLSENNNELYEKYDNQKTKLNEVLKYLFKYFKAKIII